MRCGVLRAVTYKCPIAQSAGTARKIREVNAVAEKKPAYKEVVAERDAYKHELDVMKQDRVNRQAKNSVFLNLFMRK